MIHDTQSAEISHVPKCMSCHKTIVVITGRAHCFHDNIYITLILLLWDLNTLCVVDHLWPLIYNYLEKSLHYRCFTAISLRRKEERKLKINHSPSLTWKKLGLIVCCLMKIQTSFFSEASLQIVLSRKLCFWLRFIKTYTEHKIYFIF